MDILGVELKTHVALGWVKAMPSRPTKLKIRCYIMRCSTGTVLTLCCSSFRQLTCRRRFLSQLRRRRTIARGCHERGVGLNTIFYSTLNRSWLPPITVRLLQVDLQICVYCSNEHSSLIQNTSD